MYVIRLHFGEYRQCVVLAKLQDEIRSVFDSEEEINFDSCNKLEYCLTTLTEAFRMYPSFPPGMLRILDSQGDMSVVNWTGWKYSFVLWDKPALNVRLPRNNHDLCTENKQKALR